jgi:hypothetical protein
MVSEVFAGIGAFKSMLDMAKALKDMNDAAIRNGAVIELQEKILAAREAQSSLLDRIRDLEKEVTTFEAWDAEKKRYELKSLGWGALAYMLKPAARGAEPPHWACTNCYSNRRIAIVQYTAVRNYGMRYICPACKSEINPSPEVVEGNDAKWLD